MIINDLLVKGSARVVDKIYANKVEGDLIGNADTASVATELGTQPQLTSKSAMDGFLSGTGVRYATFNTSESGTGFQSNDGMILSLPWANSTAYGAQIAFDDAKVTNVAIRGKSTTWGDWYRLLHSGNYSSYALPLTGGTLSGSLTLSSGSVTAETFASSNTLTLNSSSTIYTDRGASTSYIFKKGGTEHARFDTSGHLVPGTDSTYNIGSSDKYWANVYADTFNGYLNGNAKSVNNVIPEWSGSIANADTTWLAAWTNDGTKLKAFAKSNLLEANCYDLGSMSGKTVADLRTAIEGWISSKKSYLYPNLTASFSASENWITLWNNEDTSTAISAGSRYTIEAKTSYTATNYLMLEVTGYYDKFVYYMCLSNGTWYPVRKIAYDDHSHESAPRLSYHGSLSTDDGINNFLEANRIKSAIWTTTSSPGVSNGIIISGGYTNTNYGFQLAIDDDPTYYMALRQKGTSGWNSWKQIPMGDGTGASGTWNISIGGTAARANYLNYTNSNEINFIGNTNATEIYFNYREPSTGNTSGNTAITKYYFANRNTSTSGVELIADKFTGYATKNTKHISLTEQCQLTSYRKTVIALCLAPPTANSNINSYSSGRITMQRTNALYSPMIADISIAAAYGAIGQIRTRFIRNNGFQIFKPCVFTYNGVKYGGIEVKTSDAEASRVTFDGTTTFDIFGLDYYDTNTSSVLNQEVYDSITYDTVIIEKGWYDGENEFITTYNIGSQSVNYANSSATATKATQDASGNTITSTYATKSELANKVKIVRW